MNPEAVYRFITRLRPAFEAGDSLAVHKEAERGNVVKVEAMYDAIARVDSEALKNLLAEDVVLEMAGPPDSPTAGRWEGRDQALAGAARNYGRLDNQRPELLTLVAQGDTVVIVARERGCVRATGREYDMPWMHVITFRDGLVSRIYGFCDSHELVRAAA